MTTDPDDFDEGLTRKLNEAAAAEARLSVVQHLVNELNSGYGDTRSSSSPYKQILGADLDSAFFDAQKDGIFAKIVVKAEQQSPYGDNATTTRNFVISRDDAHALAKEGPEEYRGTFTGFAATLDKKYAAHEVERIAGIRDTVKQMAQLNAPVVAPPQAKFSNRKLRQ